MTEIKKIHLQIMALLKARNYLLHQSPSDMIAIQEVTEKIIALNERQSVLSDTTTAIPVPTDEQIAKLQSAIHELDTQIAASKTASDILIAATAIANSA